MSTPRVYIRSGWDHNTAYDSGVGELLSNNNGNHLEEQLSSLRDNLAAVIRLLVEKNLVTMPEIASACGFSKYHVITEPLSEYSFQIKSRVHHVSGISLTSYTQLLLISIWIVTIVLIQLRSRKRLLIQAHVKRCMQNIQMYLRK